MIGKTWNIGLPKEAGNYFLMEKESEIVRFARAVSLPNGTRTFVGSGEVTDGDDILSYGPVPSPERSIASPRRKHAPAIAG